MRLTRATVPLSSVEDATEEFPNRLIGRVKSGAVTRSSILEEVKGTGGGMFNIMREVGGQVLASRAM